MDYTHFTTDDVMDFIQGRIDQLRSRKQRQVGTTSHPDTRISELTHVRHAIMTRAQDAKTEAYEKAEPKPYPTLETHDRMYKDAVQVQDACNLSGVLFSFARHMQTLCDMGLDTDQKNRHPVSILFSCKIASLTGSEHGTAYVEAYEQAKGAIEMFEAYRETYGDEGMQEPQREDVGVTP